MIHFSLNPGNLPSVLAAMGSPVTVQRVVNAMAESYNDDIHDWIDAGLGFTPRSPGGSLEQAINWHPNGNGTATVYANKDYAGFVEYGTGPRDRQALRFPVSGGAGFGFARVINHPGSRPHPYFFADQGARSGRMQQKGLSVLAQEMARAQIGGG